MYTLHTEGEMLGFTLHVANFNTTATGAQMTCKRDQSDKITTAFGKLLDYFAHQHIAICTVNVQQLCKGQVPWLQKDSGVKHHLQTSGLLWRCRRKSMLVFSACIKLQSEPLLLGRGSLGIIGGSLRLGVSLCRKARGSLGRGIRLDGQSAHQAFVCFINASQPLVGLGQLLL